MDLRAENYTHSRAGSLTDSKAEIYLSTKNSTTN